MGSQVIGEDRSRLSGRGGRRASDRTKERVHRFRVRFDEREEQIACYASALTLAMTDEARREAEMSAWQSSSLLLAGSKSLSSFTNRFFHFSGPSGFRLVFDRPKRMEDLAAFSAREVKRAAAEQREKDKYSSAEGQ